MSWIVPVRRILDRTPVPCYGRNLRGPPGRFDQLATILRLLLAGIVLVNWSAAQAPPPKEVSPLTPSEYPVTVSPLAGPAAHRNSEISGLAWYGDYLILLPQWPHLLDDQLFAIPRADILAFLNGQRTDPLAPIAIPFTAPDIQQKTPHYRGLEAIAFDGDRVYLIVEGSRRPPTMSLLMAGTMAPDLSGVSIDTGHFREIMPVVPIPNFSDESLLVLANRLLTIFEANGTNVNPRPMAHLFDFDLSPVGDIPFPHMEYRITDASTVDDRGRFWAVNYFYPGEIRQLAPAEDPLVVRYGRGHTHSDNLTVERLVEFQIGETGITLTDTPPLQLELRADGAARNWEGIVRLGQRGFLLVTDRFPETLLAFVPRP